MSHRASIPPRSLRSAASAAASSTARPLSSRTPYQRFQRPAVFNTTHSPRPIAITATGPLQGHEVYPLGPLSSRSNETHPGVNTDSPREKFSPPASISALRMPGMDQIQVPSFHLGSPEEDSILSGDIPPQVSAIRGESNNGSSDIDPRLLL
ncbi:hypothetical protein DM02DRAFT_224848 [Periconia macrospinosa]|uniref:Uncharacterized protein n=1 Tax=Periconia macrospinosa TaxID=97972 RepID=A0A2V1DZW4_9PLEO|nr:hypothetical protein DM02DRAFT_224848 [Periconia macrospinosa]